MKGMAKGVLGYNEEYNPFNMPLQELINPITGKINPTAQLKYHEDWKDELSNHNPLRQELSLIHILTTSILSLFLLAGCEKDTEEIQLDVYKRQIQTWYSGRGFQILTTSSPSS